ncbi:MAG TPA: alpha/beta hydrolase [Acidimicrobiia bacterium]
MTGAPDPDAFEIHRREVRNGVALAYVREGEGGTPLLLIHGYPETKRIWWRNIAPLAAAGFEVIVPDLRGYGDSDLAADGFYDVAAFSLDLHALVHDVLGHERCAVAGGDVGGVVLRDLATRYPGFVDRLCVFNTLVMVSDDELAAAGIRPDEDHATRQTADYFHRQGTDADALLAELDTPARRRAWVAAMYRQRLWAAPGHFGAADIDFMTEPFADPDRLRAAWGTYETAFGNRPMEDVPRLFEPCTVPALVLYGPEDHVVPKTFPDRARLAFTECVGPFVVPDAGYFLQWEQADVVNRSLTYFLH